MVRAVDQRFPGVAVQVAAPDAVVDPFPFVAPIQPILFHVHRNGQRLKQLLVYQYLALRTVQQRSLNGRVQMVTVGPVQIPEE